MVTHASKTCRTGVRGLAVEWYELLSLLMRYVFAGLGAIIVWRVLRWIRRDARQYNRDMRRLPDAGLVGEMVDIESGKAYPLPREGMIGSAHGCDIRVKRKDIAGHHAVFVFEEGKGLRVTPYHRHDLSMDGTELRGSAHALHGSTLEFGRCVLRVRLFAGLNVPHPSAFMRDEGAYPDEAPAYDTPAPYDAYPPPAYDAYQTPMPAQVQPAQREDMQITWSYAVQPPNMTDTQPFRPVPREMRYADAPAPLVPDAVSEEDETPAYQSPMQARRRRRGRR